jgi:outer membrane protein
MAVSVLSRAIGRAGKSRNMRLVSGMRGAALTLIYACVRSALAGFAGALIITVLPPGAAPGKAETMSSALARAYAGNPDLNQQRAGVRATDENLPRASAAWRPTASATGQFGYNYFDLTAPVSAGAAVLGPMISGVTGLRKATDPGTLSLTVSQNLFNGNRTLNGVRQAESNIFGARETLRDTEQNVLLNGATAYMNVLRDTAILDLRKNNIIVLEEQLRQTRDRFIVGLVTGTDVAQAESSLASARSDYFTAQANLQTSVANYRQIIGVEPTRLEPARPIESLLPRSLGSAIDLSFAEHPEIQAALHAVDAAALQVKLVEGELYPTVNLGGNVQQNYNLFGVPGELFLNGSIAAQVSVPIYTGGGVYARAPSKGNARSGQAASRSPARHDPCVSGFVLGPAR